MVKYVYDGWGNHGIEVVDSACETLANLNPFRYRSYYFDTETELYFLKTRYYDPEIGRFMTIDDIKFLNSRMINGLNLYAYCFDNPIFYVDKTGCIPFASTFFKSYYQKLIGGFDSKWWGRIKYSTTTASNQTDEKGFFYAFSASNIYNGEKSVGVGINVFEWFGLEVGAVESGDVYISGNITPWFNLGVSIGLSGLTLSVSFNIGETNHELSIGIGLAPVAIVVGIVSIVFSAGQSISIVVDWFKSIFGI